MAGLPPLNSPGGSLQRGPSGEWYPDSGRGQYARKKKPRRRRPLGQQPRGIKEGVTPGFGNQRN